MSLSSTTAVADGAVIAGDLLLDRLRSSAIVWNLVDDLSIYFDDGRLTINIPNNYDVAVTDWVAAPTVADTLPAFQNQLYTFADDTLTINKFKKVGQLVADINVIASRVELFDAFLRTSVGRIAEFMESDILEEMWGNAASANYHQYSGTGNAFTVDDIDTIGQLMDEALISSEDRYAVLAPQEYTILKKTNAVRDASAFGSNLPVQNGVVGTFNGFTIINHPRLIKGHSLFFHRSSAARAVRRAVTIERQRLAQYDGDYVQLKAAYGVSVIRMGTLIFPAAAAASKPATATAIKGGNAN